MRTDTDLKQQYEMNGVVFPIRVMSGNEAAWFRQEYERIEAIFGGNLSYSRSLHLYFPWAYDLCLYPEILDQISLLLGDEIAVFGSMILTKYPRTDDYIAWHQDGMNNKSWGGEEHSLTVWLALSESNSQNGCMQVVPGSHKNSKYKHVFSSDKKNILSNYGPEIAVEVDESKALNLELHPGEISVHHQNIIHGSKANHSDSKRIGFVIRYINPQHGFSNELVFARGKKTYDHCRHIEKPREIENKSDEPAYRDYLEKRILRK